MTMVASKTVSQMELEIFKESLETISPAQMRMHFKSNRFQLNGIELKYECELRNWLMANMKHIPDLKFYPWYLCCRHDET